MIWIKPFDKTKNDPDAKITAKTYWLINDGPKRKDLGYHYSSVIAAGNGAEKEVFELVNECIGNTDYSGVCNVRIEKDVCGDKFPAEFDIIIEDKEKVIYINVKKTDEYDQQQEQIERHQNLLDNLLKELGCNKLLIPLGVITDNAESLDNFKKKLQELKNGFAGRDDILCKFLYSKDSPITHWYRIFKQFGISKQDFTEEKWKELLSYIQKVTPKLPNEDCYVGTIIDVGEAKTGITVYFKIKNIFNNGEPVNIYISKNKKYNVNTIKQYIGKTLSVFPGDCQMHGSNPFIEEFDPNVYIS
jgi:hypothetical protein